MTVCTAPGLLTTTRRRVGMGTLSAVTAGGSGPCRQSPRARSTPANASSAVTSPDNGQHGIVGQIVRAMKRHQVAARDGADRPRRTALGHAVRVESVDQTVEDDVGNVGGIVVADLQARQHLVALPLDLGRREGRAPRHVGQQIEGEVEAVLHDEDVDETEVAGRAPLPARRRCCRWRRRSAGRSGWSSPGREVDRRARATPGWPGGSAAAPARRIIRTLTAGCS